MTHSTIASLVISSFKADSGVEKFRMCDVPSCYCPNDRVVSRHQPPKELTVPNSARCYNKSDLESTARGDIAKSRPGSKSLPLPFSKPAC